MDATRLLNPLADPMTLPDLPPALTDAWADARQFAAAVRLDRPGLLWLTLLPAGLALVGFFTGRKQRGALALLGRPAAVYGLLTGPRQSGRLGRVAMFIAWTLLVVGASGPRWGKGPDDGVAVGRDVVLVLDLSRSMLADDTAGGRGRWQTAVRGAVDLLNGLRGRGGHRVALVVFAAKPKLVVPLTTDLDHLTAKLLDLDAATPPPDIRPDDDSPSGTRIGAALAAAVDAHDPRFPGAQDILLLSDGDDPADDREWAAGVSAARRASIPVSVVGVGNPFGASPIRIDGRQLTSPEPVETRLHEEVLRAIAAEGHGAYLPARQEVPRLGDFFRAVIEPAPGRELTDDALPRPRDRAAWFLGGGLALLLVGWWRER